MVVLSACTGENPPSTSVTTVVSGASGMVAGSCGVFLTVSSGMLSFFLLAQCVKTPEYLLSCAEPLPSEEAL